MGARDCAVEPAMYVYIYIYIDECVFSITLMTKKKPLVRCNSTIRYTVIIVSRMIGFLIDAVGAQQSCPIDINRQT